MGIGRNEMKKMILAILLIVPLLLAGQTTPQSKPPTAPVTPPPSTSPSTAPAAEQVPSGAIDEEALEKRIEASINEEALEKRIEQHIDRIGNQINPSEWREAAFMALMIPILGIGLSALTLWLIYRGFQSRMQTRMNLHTQLLAKFSSGAEFTEFISSKGGQQFVESLWMPRENSRERIMRSMRTGIITAAAGIGMIFMMGFNSPAVIVLAIGVGFLVSAMVSRRMSEKMDLLQPKDTVSSIDSSTPQHD